ncbi:MAG: hypothetical protein GEV03_01040 [Streptosporangiales bacterium]|nr:hypothetical protein [Streptosporangiales bacterium]
MAAVAAWARIAWETVGSIITRVMADHDADADAAVAGGAGDRLAGVRRIGIDEVSYARGDKYLVVVVDHGSGRLLWVGVGRCGSTEDDVGRLLRRPRRGPLRPDRVGQRGRGGLDRRPRHLRGAALPERGAVHGPLPRRQMGPTRPSIRCGDGCGTPPAATAPPRSPRNSKGARYALVTNPQDLTGRQAAKLSPIREVNNHLYHAYLLKEPLRLVFAPGGDDRVLLLEEWLAWAARRRIGESVELAAKMRRFHHDPRKPAKSQKFKSGPVQISARSRPRGLGAAGQPSAERTTAARRSATPWACSSLGASTITRTIGSVPLGRISTRPVSPSSASAAATAAASSADSAARDLSTPCTLTRTCGSRLITRASSSSGSPPRATAPSRCSAVSSPSPVVAWSSMTMWPDCSPPRT